ncbi:MAG: DUF1579 family protein [Pseudomonadota bacterium]|nr:DUF1579 family protein [Pseudomonadota bacterium]
MKLSTTPMYWIGSWVGTNRLWMDGSRSPALSSESRAQIAPEANGNFLHMRYRWQYEAVEQEGCLLLGNQNASDAITAAWCDSFHMSGKLMFCTGSVNASGDVDMRGSYAAPPGPDWGWRISLSMASADRLCMQMFNIDPHGLEELAVKADYLRDAQARSLDSGSTVANRQF